MSAADSHAQAANPKRHLLIIGASYAKGWGQPALPGYNITNKGVAGEKTGDVARRFAQDALQAPLPDVVLIWGHVNDITRASAATVEQAKRDAKANYLRMLDLAAAAGRPVWLATEIPLAESRGVKNTLARWVGGMRGKQSYAERVNAHVRELNDFVVAEARKRKLPLLDFHAVFDDDGVRHEEFATDDLSHITAEGYAALSQYLNRELPKLAR